MVALRSMLGLTPRLEPVTPSYRGATTFRIANDLGHRGDPLPRLPHCGQLGGIIGGGVGGFLGSITAAVRAQVQADLAHGRAKPALIKTKTLRPMSKGDTINIDVTRAAVYIVRNPLDVAMSYAHH
jgi:hypothetical protein